MIQARFERATNELQRKEAWYQENQVALSHQDEEVLYILSFIGLITWHLNCVMNLNTELFILCRNTSISAASQCFEFTFSSRDLNGSLYIYGHFVSYETLYI